MSVEEYLPRQEIVLSFPRRRVLSYISDRSKLPPSPMVMTALPRPFSMITLFCKLIILSLIPHFLGSWSTGSDSL